MEFALPSVLLVLVSEFTPLLNEFELEVARRVVALPLPRLVGLSFPLLPVGLLSFVVLPLPEFVPFELLPRVVPVFERVRVPVVVLEFPPELLSEFVSGNWLNGP